MNDLTEFLRARLDEDEATARACEGDAVVEFVAGETGDNGEPEAGAHIGRWKPSRALADVAAKRAILAEHEELDNRVGKNDSKFCAACHSDRYYNPELRPMPCTTVRLLGLPYADRPDYRPEWAPDFRPEQWKAE